MENLDYLNNILEMFFYLISIVLIVGCFWLAYYEFQRRAKILEEALKIAQECKKKYEESTQEIESNTLASQVEKLEKENQELKKLEKIEEIIMRI